MRTYLLPELLHLSRAQLFAFVAMLSEVIANPATSADDRAMANTLLQTIRLALARKQLAP